MILTDELIAMHLDGLRGDVTNVRIDAFTATSSIVGDRLRSMAFVSSLARTVDETYFAFEQSKPLVYKGARGWSKGSLRYLRKPNRKDSTKADYVLMSVTGDKSQDVFELALSYDEPFKCTRLDVAVDIAFTKPQREFLKAVYAKNSKWDKGLRIISGATGDTLYKNSRRSSMFGRVYDKSEAYNLELGTVYRFEIENKSPKSDAMKDYLEASQDTKKAMFDYTVKAFKNWALPIPADGDFVVMPKLQSVISTDASKLEWVSTISGAIRDLCKRGYEKQVREMLNLPEYRQLTLTDSTE